MDLDQPSMHWKSNVYSNQTALTLGYAPPRSPKMHWREAYIHTKKYMRPSRLIQRMDNDNIVTPSHHMVAVKVRFYVHYVSIDR